MSKLLVYDSDSSNTFHDVLRTIQMDFEIESFHTAQESIAHFIPDEYCIVFINVVDGDGKKVLHYLQEHYPKQLIAILDDSFHCCTLAKSCAHCKEHYNIHKIAKPFDYNDLIPLLKNESCHFDISDNFEKSKVMSITKKYNLFYLSLEDFHIRYKTHKSFPNQIVELMGDLSGNNIEYELKEDHSIHLPNL